jgi:hypothetical protein
MKITWRRLEAERIEEGLNFMWESRYFAIFYRKTDVIYRFRVRFWPIKMWKVFFDKYERETARRYFDCDHLLNGKVWRNYDKTPTYYKDGRRIKL